MTQYDLTQEQVVERVGKSRAAIANTLRLLDLDEEVLEMLKTGDISAGHARALLGLKDKEKVVDIAVQILDRSLSVRDTEDLVKKLSKLYEKAQNPEVEASNEIVVDYIKDLESRAMSLTGKRIKINDKGKVKTIQVEYMDNEDLEELLVKLCGKKIID